MEELSPKEKYDALYEKTRTEEGVTAEFLRDIGAQEYNHPEDGFTVWFEQYGVTGMPGDTWRVVHAGDGAEVTAELSGLPLRRILRRMNSAYMNDTPDWL